MRKINFEIYSLVLIFMRYTYVGRFSFDDTSNLQSILSRKRKNLIKTYQIKSVDYNNKKKLF